MSIPAEIAGIGSTAQKLRVSPGFDPLKAQVGPEEYFVLSRIDANWFKFAVGSLTIFAVFYGLDWVATVPPTVTLTNEVFGKRDAPVIVSWIVAGHQIGGALAALGAGETRYLTGSYVPAFLASGVACLMAALMVLRIARSRVAVAVAE